jgi:hypothetical protein
MPNLRDDHLPPVGHLTPVYPKQNFNKKKIYQDIPKYTGITYENIPR